MVIYVRWLDALMRAVCYLAAYIDDNMTFIIMIGIYQDYDTIPLYFPEDFKSHFWMTRKAVHSHSNAHISQSSYILLHYSLKLVSISVSICQIPCWIRFPGSEKLALSRKGIIELNFLVIPIFWNIRPTSQCTHKTWEWNSRNCMFHSLPHLEFQEFLVK